MGQGKFLDQERNLCQGQIPGQGQILGQGHVQGLGRGRGQCVWLHLASPDSQCLCVCGCVDSAD